MIRQLSWAIVVGITVVGRVCFGAGAAGDRERVSRADLRYDRPASRSEEGMPIGNGRMGTLVWTSPGAVHMQVNRVDVFADDSYTNSFPRAHSDYSGGCGYVDVRVGEEAEGVFGGEGFEQRLSVYDGEVVTKGKGVVVRACAWGKGDVIAVEVEDQRERPGEVHVDLRMLREAMEYVRGVSWEGLRKRHASVVQTNAQTAESALDIRDGRIVLTQKFKEDAFYCASGVAVAVVGREARAEYYNESTVRVTAAAGRGKFTILIGSAATFDPKEDVGALAIKEVEGVTGTYDNVREDCAAGWHEYWGKSFISLHSQDGVADEIERNYTYFLYVMGASSRGGKWPPRFGGMLWLSNGDMRAWGSLYWWANQSCYFNGLMPANRPELMLPTFEMYSGMYEACALAARQQWGSEGIWIPETTFWNGPAKLPEDIAAEMRDLYLLRRPWEQRSERFKWFSEMKQSFESRWNWIAQGGHFEEGHWVNAVKQPPFGHVTHIFGSTAKIARLYWQQYEYTMDEKWLRERAYPMLRGTVEFYRNFPNLKKETDGRYHIYNTNSNEPAWGVKDSDEDISAIRGVTPLLLRASEILGVDEGMRPVWREFLEHIAPVPTSDAPGALVSEGYAGPRVWVKGLKPAAKAGGMLPDGNTLPEWNFELCSLENGDAETRKVANATFDAYFERRGGLTAESPAGTLSRLAIAGAQLGRVEAVRYLVPNQVRTGDVGRGVVMRNRMALREGPGATECERLGRAAEAVQLALLQGVAGEPRGEVVIHLFPAWPGEWDARYTLAAPGGFLVSAEMKGGVVGPVRIESRAGGMCRVFNPWARRRVVVTRAGGKAEEVAGERVAFETARGEVVGLSPKGE